MVQVKIFLTFIVIICVCVFNYGCHSGSKISGISDYSNEEAIALGERIYREGILPSGEPIQAYVHGDISVDGSMFSCIMCHRKSGLGTTEGFVIVFPTNGLSLYRPKTMWDTWRRHSQTADTLSGSRTVPEFFLKGDILRPAYTDETLAQALRTGIDPSGRTLDHIMPRYKLNDSDMAILINYLKTLSAELSPGVTETTLNFATVFTEKTNPVDKDAMISVLERHVKDRSTQYRHQQNRARSGPFHKREMDTYYRQLKLSLWELKGPEKTWRSQLEEYYRKEPVFALLGGIAEDWSTIHEFSEQHHLPCIFPITDSPVVSNEEWYTLYFSKGLYQEGEGAARYLRRANELTKDTRIVQVFRKGSKGAIVARGFQETWNKFGRPSPENRVLDTEELITDQLWKELTGPQKSTVVLFWTGDRDVKSIEALNEFPDNHIMVFASSVLLGEDLSIIPDSVRDFLYITYPYCLPDEKQRNISALKTWLKYRKIPATNIRIQSKMYFVGWMLSETWPGMKNEFYREKFLEDIEMMTDQSHAIAVYPRLSFGPDQRYASKGCYIVQLSKGPDPTLIKKSKWVIH